MLKTRVIPCLLIRNGRLYKTINFKDPSYIGDPINAIKIFNDKEVDELIILDIEATRSNSEPNYSLIRDIASECFMPLAYGGGITSIAQVQKILEIGVEKVCLNTAAGINPLLISTISETFGSQSLIVSMNVKKNILGKYKLYRWVDSKLLDDDIVEFAQNLEARGVGEIMLTNVNTEGTWKGFDTELIRGIATRIQIPLIANGGAGSISDIEMVVKQGKASAVAISSMVVYQKKGFGVLISFPNRNELEKKLA